MPWAATIRPILATLDFVETDQTNSRRAGFVSFVQRTRSIGWQLDGVSLDSKTKARDGDMRGPARAIVGYAAGLACSADNGQAGLPGDFVMKSFTPQRGQRVFIRSHSCNAATTVGRSYETLA
jgi:hypothetical protein